MSHNRYTDFYNALREQDMLQISLLVRGMEKDGTINALMYDPEERESYTPLVLATIMEQDDVIDLLLNSGANPDERCGDNNYAALHHCLFLDDEGHDFRAVIRSLAKAGADVDLKIDTGDTALLIACQFDHSLDMVNTLIDVGSNVNAQDKDGYTALMYAAKKGREDIIEALLKAGAYQSIANKCNDLALDIAIRYCQFGIVNILKGT